MQLLYMGLDERAAFVSDWHRADPIDKFSSPVIKHWAVTVHAMQDCGNIEVTLGAPSKRHLHFCLFGCLDSVCLAVQPVLLGRLGSVLS